MRKAASLSLCAAAVFCFAARAGAAIAFDAATTVTAAAATEVVADHTVSGDDRFLIVSVGYDPTTSFPVTAVTYDGDALTNLCAHESNSDQGLSRWYLIAPNTGANPVTVLFSATIKSAVGIRSYTGTHQSLPIGTEACIEGDGSSTAVTIVTIEDNSWVVGAASWEGSGIITSSQTERYHVTITGGGPSTRTTILGDDEPTTVQGSVVMSYSYTIGNPFVANVFELKELPEVAPATPTRTATATPSPGPVSGLYTNPYGTQYFSAPPTATPLAEGTVALLLLDNNVDDQAGTYTWTNVAGTPFDAAIKMQGTHSAGEKDSGVAQSCIHSDAAITETIKTIELYGRQPAGGVLVDRRVWAAWDNNSMLCFLRFDRDANTVRYYAGGWSGTWPIADDTWYHFALIPDGGDANSYLYVDNIQRCTAATVETVDDAVNHIGNDWNHNNCMHGWIDFVRLSDVIQPGPYPTTD